MRRRRQPQRVGSFFVRQATLPRPQMRGFVNGGLRAGRSTSSSNGVIYVGSPQRADREDYYRRRRRRRPVHRSRAACPHIARRRRNINFSDWLSRSGGPGTRVLPYYVAKTGVIGLTEALALELALTKFAQRIAPGHILAPPTRPRTTGIGGKGEPLCSWGGESRSPPLFLRCCRLISSRRNGALAADGHSLIIMQSFAPSPSASHRYFTGPRRGRRPNSSFLEISLGTGSSDLRTWRSPSFRPVTRLDGDEHSIASSRSQPA